MSDSTASYDRAVKRPMYAAAGIKKMWLVDFRGETVEVATQPGADGYGKVSTFRAGMTLRQLSAPDVAVNVTDLFA